MSKFFKSTKGSICMKQQNGPSSSAWSASRVDGPQKSQLPLFTVIWYK